MGDIKISVIVPVYNMEKYIEQCIKSVINQTKKEIEIICINDGSTDSSENILRKLSEEDDRIRILYNKDSLGVAEARNKGIVEAKGEFLSILDADDFFENDMLENAYNMAIKCEADICIFKTKSFDGNKIEILKTIKDEWIDCKEGFSPIELNDRLFSLGPLWAWDKLFKRDLIIENDITFQNIRSTNDAKFVSLALVASNKICICDNAYAIHRMNRKSSLSVTREKSWDCFYQAIESIAVELKNVGKFDIYIQAFRNWILDFSLWNLHTINGREKQKVYDLVRNIIFPQYRILEYQKEYYLFPYLYELALKISKGDYLEQLEETERNMYRLIESTNNCKSVVIYGAGKWGKIFVNILLDKEDDISIKWVDKNWKNFPLSYVEIQDPEDVDYSDVDKIVVAVESVDAIKEIVIQLKSKGIDEDIIVCRSDFYT